MVVSTLSTYTRVVKAYERIRCCHLTVPIFYVGCTVPKNCAASFQKSLSALGKSDFELALLDELQIYESNIDLARYCEEGFPDPESIEFDIDSVVEDDGICTVHVSCKFSEAVQTGCSELAFNHPTVAKFDVILDPQLGVVTLDYNAEADNSGPIE